MKLVVVATPRDGGGWILTSPAPGVFQPSVGGGALVSGDASVGMLEVLGRNITLVVPAEVSGHVTGIARKTVQFGDPLAELVPGAAVEQHATRPTPDAATSLTGPVFRAPTSGRFYGRSAPVKPPFVQAGDELAQGATICLLEVMKTFHRVTYAGERARVGKVLVGDGDDVNAGDPLLALDPI
jgi:acetyl-CoA carboxylase biotin carboxyl carrier protein